MTALSRLRNALLPLAFLLTAAPGCGGVTCRDVQRSLTDFDRQRRQIKAPHLELQVALAPINAALARRRQMAPPLDLPLPSEGGLSTLSIALTEITLVPAEAGALAFQLQAEARYEGDALFGLSGRLEVPPEVDAEAGRVRFALSPARLRTLSLSLSPRATAALSDLLWRLLPAEAQRLTPRPLFALASKAAVEALVEQIYPLTRDHLLSHLDPISEIAVALPPLPIADLKVQTLAGEAPDEGRLVVGVITTLPVERGVISPPPPLTAEASLRASGEAVAALTNWAMRGDQLPRRFTSDGEADPQGPWEARVTWARARPDPEAPPGFDLHLWRAEGGCARIRMASVARLGLTAGPAPQVEAAVSEGEIVEVEGEAAVEALIWLNTLWRNATAFTHAVAADTTLTLGDERLQIEVVGARLDRAEARLDLRLRSLEAAH